MIKRCTGLVALASLLAAPAFADQGQGPPAPDARIEGANLGEYWFGAKVTKEDLVGKVVLFEIYGS